jgi:hypothetical protein
MKFSISRLDIRTFHVRDSKIFCPAFIFGDGHLKRPTPKIVFFVSVA